MSHITFGSAPSDESCAQVGTENYEENAHKECQEWRRQLVRFYEARGKTAPENLRLVIRSNPHDFGTYYEVVARFPDEDDESYDFAIWLENNAPPEWDDEARAALALPPLV